MSLQEGPLTPAPSVYITAAAHQDNPSAGPKGNGSMSLCSACSISLSLSLYIYICTVEGRNPASPYIDLKYQKHGNSGIKEHTYMYVYMHTYAVMQDFYEQQHVYLQGKIWQLLEDSRIYYTGT